MTDVASARRGESLWIGLMSGTSMDGVDAVLTGLAGAGRRTRARVISHAYRPYAEGLAAVVRALASGEPVLLPDMVALDAALGEEMAAAAIECARSAHVSLESVRAVACHGQTVWHQPELRQVGSVAGRGTLQIGNAAVVAARTGLPVVSGFRAADMAAGGQGAPLVPYADWALLTSARECRAVQNIGGIANVTYLPAGAGLGDVAAFDTGPGNMVIDALAWRFSLGAVRCDVDGRRAARGRAHPGLLARLLEHPYFAAAPPKSTGREVFGEPYASEVARLAVDMHLGEDDVLATATALTVESIALAYERWLSPRGAARTVVVGGGGCRNATMMRMLRDRLAPAKVTTHEAMGINDTAKEALAFALLARETMRGCPSNVPGATGAVRAVILGSVTPPPTGDRRTGRPPW